MKSLRHLDVESTKHLDSLEAYTSTKDSVVMITVVKGPNFNEYTVALSEHNARKLRDWLNAALPVK